MVAYLRKLAQIFKEAASKSPTEKLVSVLEALVILGQMAQELIGTSHLPTEAARGPQPELIGDLASKDPYQFGNGLEDLARSQEVAAERGASQGMVTSLNPTFLMALIKKAVEIMLSLLAS